MAGPTRSRTEFISSLASSLIGAMLSEVVMDVALEAHRNAVRGRAVCEVCGMRCGSVHVQSTFSNGAGPSTVAAFAPGSPTNAGKTVTGMGTPTAKDKGDGNVYFECTNCQKKIASNRYAPHLSGCLGIGTGSRRGAARNAAAKNKLGAEPDRSGSPYVGSDYGSPSEAVNGKSKGKAKNGKKLNGKAAEFGLNGNNKRVMTPDTSLSKKSKKQKASPGGSEQPAVVNSNFHKPPIPTASKQPLTHGSTSASPSAVSASQDSGHDSRSMSGSGSGSPPRGQSPSGRLSGSQQTQIGPDPSSVSSRQRYILEMEKIQPTGASAAKLRMVDKEEDPDFIDVDGDDHDETSSDGT